MNKIIFRTWYGNLAASVVAFIAVYGFGSWAVDSARMVAYALTLVFLILGTNRLAASIKMLFRK